MKQGLYLVAGLGKTGHSIASFLRRRNLPFVVFDTREHIAGLDQFKQDFPGVEVFTKDFPESLYNEICEVITSPGISLETPFLMDASKRNISIIGDIECLAREVRAPIIAITGTNGKSTVTTLVGEMAKAAGFTVAVAGNIGEPVLDLLDNDKQYNLWVLELSSFQLEVTQSLAPLAATVLNVSPDHLDRHHTITAYAQVKQRIYQHAQNCIYNREDSFTLPSVNDTTIISFGLDKPNINQWGIIVEDNQSFIAHGNAALLNSEQLCLKGKHNWQNILAACALATKAGIDKQIIIEVLQHFAGLPHRTQWVRKLDGVDWINDSKGTNVGATISAIAGIGSAINGRIVLIAGGLGKGADFTALQDVVRQYVRCVVLIGKDADQIEQALQGCTPIEKAATMVEATTRARLQAQANDVVLLSPACASQDMFNDFNHRGEVFSAIVNGL